MIPVVLLWCLFFSQAVAHEGGCATAQDGCRVNSTSNDETDETDGYGFMRMNTSWTDSGSGARKVTSRGFENPKPKFQRGKGFKCVMFSEGSDADWESFSSIRNWEQFLQGKGYDKFGPAGPVGPIHKYKHAGVSDTKAEEAKILFNHCVPRLSPDLGTALINSAGYCPKHRGEENIPEADEGSHTTQLETRLALAPQVGPENVLWGPGPSTSKKNYALYTTAQEMRYDDKLIFWHPSDARSDSNPPLDPFINVQQMISQTYDGHMRTAYAAQGPLAGSAFEGQCGIEPKDKIKNSNICKWMKFLYKEGFDMLVSLAPSAKERFEGQNRKACKERTIDYIHKIQTTSGEGQQTKNDIICEKADRQEHDITCDAGLTITVTEKEGGFGEYKDLNFIQRTITFTEEAGAGAHEMDDIYFDQWPDAHGEANPPVPKVRSLEKMLKLAAAKTKVAVHCAGGKGRTATLILGLKQQWKKNHAQVISADSMVDDLLDMREVRGNFVEHPSQLMLLGKIFLSYSDDNCKLNQVANTAFTGEDKPFCRVRYEGACTQCPKLTEDDKPFQSLEPTT